MSLDLLEQLESRVQNALDTMELMQIELDEEKERNASLLEQQERLNEENIRLNAELAEWNRKIEGLLGRLPNDNAA